MPFPEASLILANAGLCAGLASISDTLAQALENMWKKRKFKIKKKQQMEDGSQKTVDEDVTQEEPVYSHDFIRTLRFACVGFAAGSFDTIEFILLEEVVTGQMSFRVAVTKTLIDVIICIPQYTAQVAFNTLLKERSFVAIWHNIRYNFKDIFIGGMVFTPTWDMIQFFFIPVEWQPIAMRAAIGVFDIYLSFIANRPIVEEADGGEVEVDESELPPSKNKELVTDTETEEEFPSRPQQEKPTEGGETPEPR